MRTSYMRYRKICLFGSSIFVLLFVFLNVHSIQDFEPINLQASNENIEIPQNEQLSVPFVGFIPNKGQFSSPLHYYTSIGDYIIGFTNSSIYYQVVNVQNTVNFFNISYLHSNSSPIPRELRTNKVNYFFGDKSFGNLSTYDEIWFENLYPYIDLRFYSTGTAL